MPFVGPYSKGGAYANSGYQLVRAMIAERVGVPDVADDLTGQVQLVTFINKFRQKIASGCTSFLNTVVHPSGSLHGASSITNWTKSTLLAAAGIGGLDGFGDRNWTNIPSALLGGDAWDIATYTGSNIYGTSLPNGAVLYDVWFNELILACRQLTHYAVAGPYWGSITDPTDINGQNTDRRYGGDFADQMMAGTCQSAKDAASAAWDAGGWVVAAQRPGIYAATNYNGAGYGAVLTNDRARFYYDFSLYTGAVAVYAYFEANGDGGTIGGYAGNNTWQQLDAATAGAAWQSGILGDVKGSFPASCTSDVQALGWAVSASRLVHAPVYTYT